MSNKFPENMLNSLSTINADKKINDDIEFNTLNTDKKINDNEINDDINNNDVVSHIDESHVNSSIIIDELKKKLSMDDINKLLSSHFTLPHLYSLSKEDLLPLPLRRETMND